MLPAAGQAALALQFQLQRTQRWPAHTLTEHQFRQLRELVVHAVNTVPFYRDHMRRARIFTGIGINPVSFKRWPVLTRPEVRAAGDTLLTSRIPQAHGTIEWRSTSGSTGHPIRTAMSELDGLFRAAALIRAYAWYGIDTRGKFASIRPGVTKRQHDSWGLLYAGLATTGPLATLQINEDIGLQLDWLCDEAPDYLLSLGNNLRSLIVLGRERGRRPSGLRALLSYADRPPSDLAALAREEWKVPVHDLYSSAEFGPIALACPEHGNLHVQSENVMVEILDEKENDCEAGQTGKVVITSLHNFAMPLIRYDIGDYATVGVPCRCGRTLPVIEAVQGRARNMATDPTGRRFWPMITPYIWLETPITQRRLVQRTAQAIEVQYVSPRELGDDEKARIVAALARNFRYAFDFTFTRMASIDAGPGAKFEDFLSMLDVD